MDHDIGAGLRENFSAKSKWHSAFDAIRATNRLQALSANRLASSGSSGGWGGISSGVASKARSYKGTTSDEESGSEDRNVVIMDEHLHGHGDEKKEGIDHISASGPNPRRVLPPLDPTSSTSNYQALAAGAFETSRTEVNQLLKPPSVDCDHDTSSDEDRSHKIPGAFVWTPTRPRFKKLHPQ